MSAFLVITRYKRFSPDGNAVMQVFQRWKHVVLSDDPYTVVIGASLTRDQFVEQLRQFPFEYKVTELGKSVTVRGVGVEVTFSMGAGQEEFL